jgi:hypothetical protein
MHFFLDMFIFTGLGHSVDKPVFLERIKEHALCSGHVHLHWGTGHMHKTQDTRKNCVCKPLCCLHFQSMCSQEEPTDVAYMLAGNCETSFLQTF